jgi:BioD-like phosphotransacetylase family protein
MGRMNEVTPRIFVAGTQQNDGKTTTCMGLISVLKRRFERIGFIKPVGQRTVEVDGKSIDEDTVLVDDTYGLHTPLEAMSPVTVDSDFTRRYVKNANPDFFMKRIQNSFDRAAWEKNFCLIEGTGHAGVGSVFDLSNARVAGILKSKAILVCPGGIGKPIDEVSLNRAVFDREGVELVGVIMNKVLPEKLDFIREYAGKGLERLGMELIGCIPAEPVLAHPTLHQIREQVKGEFINGEWKGRRRVEKVMIGAMTPSNVMQHLSQQTLVVTSGDREDVIMAALATNSLAKNAGDELVGMVLAGGYLPHDTVMQLINLSDIPIIVSPYDSYTIARNIHQMTIKTLPGDREKIAKIQNLIETYVNIDRLLEKIHAPRGGNHQPLPPSITTPSAGAPTEETPPPLPALSPDSGEAVAAAPLIENLNVFDTQRFKRPKKG